MAAGRWEYLWLAFLGQPKSDRQLYRLIKRHQPRRIVELGIGSVDRALRLIRVSQRYAAGQPVSYAGLDRFEERSESMAPIKLIDAHRRLKATGAEVRLMPGGPTAGLPSVANALSDTDLLLISPEADEAALESAWFFLPRMLTPQTVILRATSPAGDAGRAEQVSWAALTMEEIECRATAGAAKRAA